MRAAWRPMKAWTPTPVTGDETVGTYGVLTDQRPSPEVQPPDDSSPPVATAPAKPSFH